MRIGSAVLACLVLPVVAHGATYHVPADYATIQGALDVSASGDTVLVAPGTYSDYTVIDGASRVAALPKGVTLRSEAGASQTTIDLAPITGSLYVIGFTCFNNDFDIGNRIEGFRVTGHPAPHGWAASFLAGAHVEMRDCIVDPGVPPDSLVDRRGIVSGAYELRVVNCAFRRCSNTIGSAILQHGGQVVVDSCSFLDGAGNPIEAVGGPAYFLRTLAIRNSLFQGGFSNHWLIRGQAMDSLVVESCRFQGLSECPGAIGNFLYEGMTRIENNIFADLNGVLTPIQCRGNATITGNTFAFITAVSQTALRTDTFPVFTHNLIANTSGAHAVDPTQGRYNIFWNNAGGNGTMRPGDFEVDPLFCDPDARDLHVRKNSPCLPENNVPDCTEFIGALGAACLPSGDVVHGIDIVPRSGVPVHVDGASEAAPALYAWNPGTVHTVGIDSIQAGSVGTRYVFASWDDGGAREHQVTAGSVPSTLTAFYDTQYHLSTPVDSGGSVLGGGWAVPGTVLTLTALPDSGYVFHYWYGSGPGSYTGLDNPITVTLNGPVSEKAHFRPAQYPLTMIAGPGGTVTPPTGPQDSGSEVTIEAAPLPGYAFGSWAGVGVGSYTGTENPAIVRMEAPLTETATFVDAFPVLTMVAEHGSTDPPTGPQPLGSVVPIEATPAFGYAFTGWVGQGNGSYTGPDNPASVTMLGPLTQTAEFENVAFDLQMLASEGGTVTPGSGSQTSFSQVEIAALPDAHHVFGTWKGSGDGSYTGPAPVATITMNEPITQVATFDRIAYELSLSLSDTDPQVHTGPPLGFGHVYLWLVCSTTGGVSALRAETAGTLDQLGFTPAPGILSAGTRAKLDLAMLSCVESPALLGEFFILPPGEGSLCLGTSAATPEMYIENCRLPAVRFTWPRDILVTGVRTDGGEPCRLGRGCDEFFSSNSPVAVPGPAVGIVQADELWGGFPNPFVSGTTIRYTLSGTSRVQVSVFDVTGRRIRSLVDEEAPLGMHDVRWNGRDSLGRRVSAGIYFVRLDAGSFTATRKVTRLGPD